MFFNAKSRNALAKTILFAKFIVFFFEGGANFLEPAGEHQLASWGRRPWVVECFVFLRIFKVFVGLGLV